MNEHNTKKYDSIAESAASYDARKRLFLGLITLTCLLVCVFLILLWVVPYVGLRTISPAAPWVLGAMVGALILLVSWAFWSLVLNIVLGRPLFMGHRLRGVTIKLFLPLMILVGRLLKIPKQKVRGSFIKVNNELVMSEADRYPAEKVLMLMPHCLQNSRCDMRLTYDIENCKRCGKCPIKGLLEFKDLYGVHMAVATGGTIARRLVVRIRPRFIVAVACERDLSSGIQDTYPLPVFGVLNERPHGPCLDTLVSLQAVETALRHFLDKDSLDKADARIREKAEERARKKKAREEKKARENRTADAAG